MFKCTLTGKISPLILSVTLQMDTLVLDKGFLCVLQIKHLLLMLFVNKVSTHIGGVLSGKVGTGRCVPDRAPFRPPRFINDPFCI